MYLLTFLKLYKGTILIMYTAKKVCQYCYGGRACSTCLLSLDNLDQLGVEEFVCPDFQNQKTFEDKLNRIFSYLEKCPSEFFQIINHLITE